MKSKLFLCGAGNAEGVRLALRVNEKLNKWEDIIILDDDSSKFGKELVGVQIAGSFDILRDANPETAEVVNLVARTSVKRKLAYNRIAEYKIPFTTLIDPAIDVWGVKFASDVIIYPNVTFSAGAEIGQGSVVFTGAVIGHGCRVGKFCVIAPGAVLNARIIIEDSVYIGTNASILPDLKIGSGATIGLNSGVVQDIPSGATAIGVPAELVITQKSFANNNEMGKSSVTSPSKEWTGDVQEKILNIWKELLNIDSIDLDDNFFDIGGSSVLAVQLHEKLKKQIESKLSLIDVFHYPTLNLLANFINQKKQTTTEFSQTLNSKRVEIFRQRFSSHKLDNNNLNYDSKKARENRE